MNKSFTGKFHILIGISFLYNVCTLFGFAKSEAILARSLLFATPTFTVNPSSNSALLFISIALFNNVSFIKYSVISKKHSSILYLSILSV